jgi:ComF family protein
MEWQTKIQMLYRKFLSSLGLCDLCGNNLQNKTTPNQTLLCSSCLTNLPLFKQDLIQGDLLNWPSINKALPKIQFDHLVCLSPYLAPFTQWLPQFKYQGRFELASLFAHLLAQQWKNENLTSLVSSVDLILSVPLHISKWQVRGYNQAHLLAKYFAHHMQLPYDESALIRSKKNISQVGKTGIQRRNNLANAFTLAKKLPDSTKHVILVDDVLTTGSTASEISKILKCVGVKKVTITAICLTLPNT